MDYRVVLVTAKNSEEAKKIASSILEQKLAACVNIVNGMESMYWWEGRVNTDSETLMIIKTNVSRVEPLIREIKKLHSYTVPEIITLAVNEGSEDYLKWIDDSIR